VKAVVSEVFLKQESGGAMSVLTNSKGSGNAGGIGDIMQNSEVIANIGTANVTEYEGRTGYVFDTVTQQS
jgi:hypothetical protein